MNDHFSLFGSKPPLGRRLPEFHSLAFRRLTRGAAPLRTFLTQSFVAAGLSLLLCGCSLHSHKQVSASLLDEKVTVERVETALKSASETEFKDIHATINGDTVSLSGFVKNEAARQRAAQIATTVHRVEKLENNIQVHP
jgi:hypothetical protein